MVDGEKTVLNATGSAEERALLEPRTIPISTMSTPSSRWTARSWTSTSMTTGFRKTEFKGGAGTGGV